MRPSDDRSLAEAVEGLLAGGPDVPHVQTGERKGQAVPRWEKNFPPVAHPSNRPHARHTGPARNLSGDEADAGNGNQVGSQKPSPFLDTHPMQLYL